MKKLKKEAHITYVFIDATNIIYGATRSGWRMDFEKLAKYLRERFYAKQILYYAGVDDENKKQLKFYEKLQEFGYTLRLIPVKRFRDGHKKADVDSRMTFELMRYLKSYNLCIIMTGDGDYFWVLEYLLQQNKKILLFSHKKSTARELKQLVKGEYTDLERLKPFLAKKLR